MASTTGSTTAAVSVPVPPTPGVVVTIDEEDKLSTVSDWGSDRSDVSDTDVIVVPPLDSTVYNPVTKELIIEGDEKISLWIVNHQEKWKTLKRLDISGLQMLCPELPDTLESLAIRNTPIEHLPTLPKGLYELVTHNTGLFTLPQLPEGLRRLHCSFSPKMTSLPSLPNSLKTLYCAVSQLCYLPSLPDGITHIQCSFNRIVDLPGLPRDLIELDCSANHLSRLPGLPKGLTKLLCSNNIIRALPKLPLGLQSLNCHNNFLSYLPGLPEGLLFLDCSMNNFMCLPEKLPLQLRELRCHDNELISLPVGLTSLKELTTLDCSDNQLRVLPSLPGSLVKLICYNNPQLKEVSVLPAGLKTLTCSIRLKTPYVAGLTKTIWSFDRKTDFELESSVQKENTTVDTYTPEAEKK